ncbi:MAG: D-aminoacyl-tRNA deacylase [Flavobacteriaceae bacterium]|nr:D-aminoacyl-tRNA deacylase [Flavobacteriaceae bacterium]
MRVVIQRVNNANVIVDNNEVASIKKGLLVFVGIVSNDSIDDINWISNKIVNLRIFDDENGVMNNSLKDISGEILVVSQFSLMAMTKKGNRPSYIKAANSKIAIPLYENFKKIIKKNLGNKVESGIFGADMEINLSNNGPMTIIIDSKNRE